MATGVVIVGGGQAGFQTAQSLRDGGYGDPVRLICAETHLPYQLPPLSKAYLTGEADAATLAYRPANYFADHDIELIAGLAVAALDPEDRKVTLSDGRGIGFEHAVLATGSTVRTLPQAGSHANLFYLRTLDDADAIKQTLETARDVVVIGGGFIGLEAAASARKLGKQVTVFEAAERLMGRVVPPVISDYFAGLHVSHGVDIRLAAALTGIEPDGDRLVVACGDGQDVTADLVVIGIGVEPHVALARDAGIECDNGILVDEYCRTSAPNIYAAGDCTNQNLLYTGTRVRLESVQNAIDQGRTAAAAILGEDKPNRAVPWFWSDQYDVKLQMAGLSLGHDDQVLRGDPEDGPFSVFYFDAGRLIAVDSVSRPADHMFARRFLGTGKTITAAQAADTELKLKELL
jgi:3-phenylpropionate/trans-cinnamate dioxygenase ferredoxin reductase subunit